jgi:hypothetical protein
VRFFFLRVFAISVNNNTHSFSRFLSTEQRRDQEEEDTKKTKKKKKNSKRLLNTNEGGGVFLSFLRANDSLIMSEEEKTLNPKETSARTEKYEHRASFSTTHKSHVTKKKKKRTTIIVFPRSPLRTRY